MWRVTWKSITSHKLRLLMTSLSIALGVSFVAGALMLGATMTKTFDDMFSSAFRDWDGAVRSSTAISNSGFEERPPIDQSITATVQAVPGVTVVSESVDGFAQLVDEDGKPVSSGGPPQFGAAWDAAHPSPWVLSEGRDPAHDDEVVIDAGLAERAKVEVGDRVSVLTNDVPKQVTIAGIAKFGSVKSPAGAQFVMFNGTAGAQKYIGEPGKISMLYVQAEDGLSQQQIVDRIRPVVGESYDVVTGEEIVEENQDAINQALGIVSTVLAAFGGIALFVAAFIINNTFSIILAQRGKEMALLRAIGATRRQVLRSVMLEAFATGLLASLAGLFLGILVSVGLQSLLQAFGIDLPTSGLVIPSSAVVTALVAGTLITLFSAYFPARRSSLIPPVAALREMAIDESSRSVTRLATGLVVSILGVIALIVGLTTGVEKPFFVVIAGAALVFTGVYLLGPVIARPASSIIGWPLPKIKGVTGQLARDNAMRNPRRTSSTAAALMIGVALVTLASVFFTSLKSSLEQTVDRTFGGDFIISSSNFMTGLPPALAEDLRQRSELGTVAALRGASARVDDTSEWLTAVSPADFDKIIDLEVTDGDFAAMTGNSIAVSREHADNNDLSVGSTVKLELTTGVTEPRVVAIFDNDTTGVLIVPMQTVENVMSADYDQMVFASVASGVSDEAARTAVDDTVKPYLTAKVQDQTEYKAEITKQINQALAMFFVLLGLAILIALLGIANTLALSVFERTRELGLLRAVGMTRRQVRSMVRWEAVIVALLGTALGMIIGVAFGAALVKAAEGEGLEVLSIPWLILLVILVVAAIAGILAAIFPARRGARIDVLRAIVSD
jgi:putative ABC transport system permease protein